MARRHVSALSLSLLVCLPPVAGAQSAPDVWSVVAPASKLTYHAIHKLHGVVGESRAIVGKARITPTGEAQVMVRVTTLSFDSGNVNRDAHIHEALEAARFPTIEVKAIADGVHPPERFPAHVTLPARVQLLFHGETELLAVPIELVWETPRRMHASCKLDVSLARHKVKAPSLMFIAVDDLLHIEADLTLER